MCVPESSRLLAASVASFEVGGKLPNPTRGRRSQGAGGERCGAPFPSRPHDPNPHFSPAFYCGGARSRICCVALGPGARRTASTPARALHLRTLAPPRDKGW